MKKRNRITVAFLAALMSLGAVWSSQPVVNPYRPVAVPAVDTITYLSTGRIAYKVPAATAVETLYNTAGDVVATITNTTIDSSVVSPNVVRNAAIIHSPNGDSVLLITYDTLAMSPMDSAAVDANLIAWGTTTIGYTVFVPGAPIFVPVDPPAETPLDSLGISTGDSARISNLLGFPYLGWYGDSTNIPQLAEMDSLFAFWHDSLWADFVADYAANDLNGVFGHGQYSRARATYAQWWRTGDLKWYRRADSLHQAYIDVFQQPPCRDHASRHFPVAHWLHVFAQGDSTTVDCLEEQADVNWVLFGDEYGITKGARDDGRIQGRTAEGVMLLGLYHPNYVGSESGTTGWDTIASKPILDSLFAWHANTASASKGVYRQEAYCDAMNSWMIGHAINYNYYRYRDLFLHTQADADSINSITKATLDTLLTTWRTDDNRDGVDIYGFGYLYDVPAVNEPCGNGDELAAHEHGMLIAAGLAAYYNRTGDDNYGRWVDSLVKYSIEWNDDGWVFSSGKQFNQAFYQFHQIGNWLSFVLLEPNSVTWTADNSTNKTIDISWVDTNNSNYAHIAYYSLDGGAWVLGDTITAGTSTYQFTGLPSSGTFELAVTAFRRGRESALVASEIQVTW